jgi:hypothetical protein
LAALICSLDGGNHEDAAKNKDADKLARVLASLKSVSVGLTNHKTLDKTNLSTEDSDFHANAICQLKEVNMTKREAETCAGWGSSKSEKC